MHKILSLAESLQKKNISLRADTCDMFFKYYTMLKSCRWEKFEKIIKIHWREEFCEYLKMCRESFKEGMRTFKNCIVLEFFFLNQIIIFGIP
jgi:hypothetical protein